MKYKVTLNDRVYEVVVEKGDAMIESEYDAVAPVVPVQQAVQPTVATVSTPSTATAGGNTFNSPLPGTIVAIKCEVGKTYKAGDVLFVVESMKMENDVTIDKDATVSAILVTKGQNIQSGTVLCTLK